MIMNIHHVAAGTIVFIILLLLGVVVNYQRIQILQTEIQLLEAKSHRDRTRTESEALAKSLDSLSGVVQHLYQSFKEIDKMLQEFRKNQENNQSLADKNLLPDYSDIFKRRYRLCIAVPSAARPDVTTDKMLEMLRSLHKEIDQTQDIIMIRQSFSARHNIEQRKLAQQLGIIVETDNIGWPSIDSPSLKRTLGDTFARVRWRSKQVGDFAMALQSCAKLNTPYVLLLEDDANVAKDFTSKLFQRLERVPNQNFGYITLYSGKNPPSKQPVRKIVAKNKENWFHGGNGAHGAVALLFRGQVIPGLVNYLLQEQTAMPVDWLIPGYLGGELGLENFELVPNLAQHASAKSTFKMNKDRDKWKSFSFIYDEKSPN